jgi:hypothetical protein
MESGRKKTQAGVGAETSQEARLKSHLCLASKQKKPKFFRLFIR